MSKEKEHFSYSKAFPCNRNDKSGNVSNYYPEHTGHVSLNSVTVDLRFSNVEAKNANEREKINLKPTWKTLNHLPVSF